MYAPTTSRLAATGNVIAAFWPNSRSRSSKANTRVTLLTAEYGVNQVSIRCTARIMSTIGRATNEKRTVMVEASGPLKTALHRKARLITSVPRTNENSKGASHIEEGTSPNLISAAADITPKYMPTTMKIMISAARNLPNHIAVLPTGFAKSEYPVFREIRPAAHRFLQALL